MNKLQTNVVQSENIIMIFEYTSAWKKIVPLISLNFQKRNGNIVSFSFEDTYCYIVYFLEKHKELIWIFFVDLFLFLKKF